MTAELLPVGRAKSKAALWGAPRSSHSGILDRHAVEMPSGTGS